jgi:molybdate transport system substrate-binding protein
LSPQVTKLGQYVLIPESLHDPLRQRMALVKGAGETARAFYGYLQEPQARAILKRYGFVLPGE